MENKKFCKQCGRELPLDTDHFFKKCDTTDGYTNRCKECLGKHFTNYLTHIPKEGHIFCKKCDRELPFTREYFPIDKNCVNGLRFICRECSGTHFIFNKSEREYWSEDDISRLIEVYPHYTNKEIQEKFFPNRSIRSIGTQADIYNAPPKTQDAYNRSRREAAAIVSDKMKGRVITEEAKQKMSETKKKNFLLYGSPLKGRHFTAERCKNISKAKKELGKWVGNKNPRATNPLNGELNGNWQGGKTDIYFELRSDTKQWKTDSMKMCNYKCVLTGGEFKNIHHLVPFRKIVDEAFKITHIVIKEKVSDYSEDEMITLRDTISGLHNFYGLGVCLCFDLHKLFHDNFGYRDFTKDNFLTFVEELKSHKYDDFLIERNIQLNINNEIINKIRK